MRTMKILVLGGNRFVGKRLTEKLLSESNDVTILNRTGTGPVGANIKKFDRNNISDIKSIDFNSFDCIIDMCLYLPKQFKLIEPYIDDKVCYIFISSVSAYKDSNIFPIDETNEIGGMKEFGDYAREKAEVEILLNKSNINYRILRPSFIDGMDSHIARIGYYINKIQKNEPIEISEDGNGLINLVFVDDVVNCIYEMCWHSQRSRYSRRCEDYNICSDEVVSINSLIDFLCEKLNVENVIKNYNSDDAILPNVNFIFSNTKVKEHYKIKFTNLEEGFSEYIDWFNKGGKIKYGY